jgi:acyl-CoA thioesterase
MTGPDIVNHMYSRDVFSQWLGIKVIEQGEGFIKLEMKIRAEMLNGFNILHGGIIYSLADSALAFASNASGKHAVSIESSISHFKTVQTGEILIAHASTIKEGRSISVFHVSVRKDNNELVADFKGTVYRKEISWAIS